MSTDPVTIDERFNGPPSSANGGYAAGVAATFIDGPAVVTLRQPPPLAHPLAVHRADGAVELRDGDRVIVHAEPARLALDVPAPVDLDQAREAATRYPNYEDHPYPACFVCGPKRPDDDGLSIYSGPVERADDVWAAPWVPSEDLAAGGVVDERVVWAALDCPTYFAVSHGAVNAVLGRLTAQLERPVHSGEPHVAVSWPLGRDGRKLFGGSAVLTDDGDVCARASATWIEIEQAFD